MLQFSMMMYRSFGLASSSLRSQSRSFGPKEKNSSCGHSKPERTQSNDQRTSREVSGGVQPVVKGQGSVPLEEDPESLFSPMLKSCSFWRDPSEAGSAPDTKFISTDSFDIEVHAETVDGIEPES